MTPFEITYNILAIINWVAIGLSTLGFVFQIIYIFFAFLKEKSFPKAEKQHRIAVLITARNEEDVIYTTIKNILDGQTYPRELFKVFVVADNCTDKTADRAKEAGAIVYVHNDANPKTHMAAYGLKYGIERILKEYPDDFDFLIRFDADNRAKSNYLEIMNDAFDSGVEVARPFEASTNGTQNVWTKVSSTYYYRDSRIPSNFRERTHMDSMLTGAGMMCTMEVFKQKGWDSLCMSEDAGFTIERLLENRRVHYVGDAVVYEDQPSTIKDTYKRLTRMGHGLHSLFWKKGWPLLGHFFKSGKFSNIDLFVQLLFVPISVVCCLWFPAYYIFFALSHIINAFGPNFMTFLTPDQSLGIFYELLWLIALILGIFFIIYPFQTWLALKLSQKKLELNNLKGYRTGILLSAFFMVFYGLAITIGVLKKPKWEKISRNIESNPSENDSAH